LIRTGSRTTGRTGFTLIEATVATVMLMIVISSIYGTFRAANVSMARMEERADVYQTARVLLDQINTELCSAYQPSGAEKSSLIGEDTPASESAPQYDKITFLTTARHSLSRAEAAGELCQITYRMESTPDGKPVGLFVEEDFRPGLSLPTAERRAIEVSNMVVGFNCRYLDGQTGEWCTDWMDRTEIPKAVRVELLVKPERKDAKPILVATTANLAISSGPGTEQAVEEEKVEE